MQSVEKPIQFLVKKEGVITCFLSLILLLILSLVSVTLESARVAGARFLTDSYTRMAMDSVMAGYSGALFDRYHVFAYNTGETSQSEIEAVLKTETEYYINRNLQAGNQMLWSPVLQEVQIDDYRLLTEERGKVFREEAAEYMKYRGTAVLVELLFSSLGVFQGAQETMELMEAKAETEEALAEIDACILDLFESVDGFVRDDLGIRQNIWGKVKVKKYFVKKLLFDEVTTESTQINHDVLFEAVQAQYLNPQEQIDGMMGHLEEFDTAEERLKEIGVRLEALEEESFFSNPAASAEKALLEAEQVFYMGKLQLASLQYRSALRDWKFVVSGCKEATQKALATLEEIRNKQALAVNKVLQYEDQLLEAAEWLDTSLYEELIKGLATMKQYVDLETEGAQCITDIVQMEKSLIQNEDVLSRVMELIEENAQEESQTSGLARLMLAEASLAISDYTQEGLCFDYSEIHLEAEGESPVDGFQNLLLCGVSELILEDTAEIPQTTLTDGSLVSIALTEAPAPEEGDGSMGWLDAESAGMSSVLGTMNDNSPFAGVVSWIGKEGAELFERVLFLSYLSDHFSNYEKQREAESVLAHEQEYILCGNLRDDLNLYEVIGRILLVRIVFNLIHVLSDAEKCGVAQETAVGLLGVTGLPILVSMMKFLILFVWATEGALVETAALLQGKKLSAMPTKEEFPVGFSELLLMSKTMIQQKAEQLSDKEGVAFGYSEYLMLFLLLQNIEIQSMRALDLIQENLALEESGFRVSQLVCSFTAQAKYMVPELFTDLPFSRRKTGGYIV